MRQIVLEQVEVPSRLGVFLGPPKDGSRTPDRGGAINV